VTESERPREAVLRSGTGRMVAVASIAKNYKRDPIISSPAQSTSTTPGGEAPRVAPRHTNRDIAVPEVGSSGITAATPELIGADS